MVLMVDKDALKKYKQDPSVPLAEVVDSFQLLKYDNAGRSGTKSKPSKQEIQDVFGTSRDDDVVKFMLEHGQLHGSPM
jgi:ribosome maturation protein Sdo1